MFASNALILAMNPAPLAAGLLSDARFGRVEWTDTWQKALLLLDDSAFDLLIVQDTLCGTDGKQLIKCVVERCPITPPRVLLLTAVSAKRQSISQLSDLCLPLESPLQTIVDYAARMMESPLPALCVKQFQKRLDLGRSCLAQMRFPQHLKGTDAIAYGSALLSCSLRNDHLLRGWLYPHIARYLDCSASSVERNIRTAAEFAWLKGDLESIQRYFGLSYDAEKGKPTNAELLYTIADHIRRSF